VRTSPRLMALIHQVFLSLMAAWFLSPWLRVQLAELPVGDIESWAAKGDAPTKPGFPQHLAGLYYVHKSVVPGSSAISAVTHLDFTHCEWDNETRTMYFDISKPYNFIIANSSSPKMEPTITIKTLSILLGVLRFNIWVEWNEDFTKGTIYPRHGIFGGGPLLPSNWYQSELTAIASDGSSMERKTCAGWFAEDFNCTTDGAASSAKTLRVAQMSGNLDKGVVKMMEQTWGDTFVNPLFSGGAYFPY